MWPFNIHSTHMGIAFIPEIMYLIIGCVDCQKNTFGAAAIKDCFDSSDGSTHLHSTRWFFFLRSKPSAALICGRSRQIENSNQVDVQNEFLLVKEPLSPSLVLLNASHNYIMITTQPSADNRDSPACKCHTGFWTVLHLIVACVPYWIVLWIKCVGVSIMHSD